MTSPFTPDITHEIEIALIMEFLADKLRGAYGKITIGEAIETMVILNKSRQMWFGFPESRRATAKQFCEAK